MWQIITHAEFISIVLLGDICENVQKPWDFVEPDDISDNILVKWHMHDTCVCYEISLMSVEIRLTLWFDLDDRYDTIPTNLQKIEPEAKLRLNWEWDKNREK